MPRITAKTRIQKDAEAQVKRFSDRFGPFVVASDSSSLPGAERPEGLRVPFIAYPTLLYDKSGILIGAVNMLVDITDQERAEEYAQRLAAIVASSEDAIISKDLNGMITSWNTGAERLFGYAAEEAIGKPITLLIPVERQEEEPAILERIRRGEGIDHYETIRRRKDGSLVDISLTVSPIKNAEGRIVGVSKIARDITEKRKAEEQQHLLIQELNLRRLEAEAANGVKSRFLATMSHEIRTPMSGVLGLLGVMLDDALSNKQRERAKIALVSARSLLQILNDILDFSKLEANQIRVSGETVDVRQVVREVMELMAAGAEQKGLSLTYEVSAQVPDWIVTDPVRLRQILTNLVSNATKFTEAGEVTVRVYYASSSSGDELLVDVQDTGIGISEGQCDQIFQDFVQADNSLARCAEGTGLGLAISKQLVELMGGRISVRSVPGNGSTFNFRVQTRPGVSPAFEPVAPSAEIPPEAQLGLPPMRILLAEDNATNQYLINSFLRAAGHIVVTVNNGAQAVSAVQAGAFDVVLMDVQMPHTDGLSATRAIRVLPGRAAAIPIVALTANAMSGDRETCIAAGMTDYLSKPIDLSALHDALLRSSPRRGSAADLDGDAKPSVEAE